MRNTTYLDRLRPEFFSWKAMRERCLSPASKDWPAYGGKGIKISKRWKTFENFLADMGNRPENTTLGRKDNEGDYTPKNCRWETYSQQNRNRTITKLSLEIAAKIIQFKRQGHTYAETGAKFGVSATYARRICKGEAWSEATELYLSWSKP